MRLYQDAHLAEHYEHRHDGEHVRHGAAAPLALLSDAKYAHASLPLSPYPCASRTLDAVLAASHSLAHARLRFGCGLRRACALHMANGWAKGTANYAGGPYLCLKVTSTRRAAKESGL